MRREVRVVRRAERICSAAAALFAERRGQRGALGTCTLLHNKLKAIRVPLSARPTRVSPLPTLLHRSLHSPTARLCSPSLLKLYLSISTNDHSTHFPQENRLDPLMSIYI